MRHLRLETHLVVLLLLDYLVNLLVQIVLIPANLMLISLLNPTYTYSIVVLNRYEIFDLLFDIRLLS